MSVQTRSRGRAVSAFVVIVMCIGATFAACTETKKAIGDDCIKDVECVSGVCSASRCAGTPPLLTGPLPVADGGEAGADASGGADAGADAGAADAGIDGDASDDGPAADSSTHDATDASTGFLDAADTSSPVDSGPDAADALAQADAPFDSSLDAALDAMLDADLDGALDADLDASKDVSLDLDAAQDVADVGIPDVLGG